MNPLYLIGSLSTSRVNQADFLFNLFMFLLVAIIFFLIIRELVTWYYKINKRIELSEEILETLQRIEAGINSSNNVDSENIVKTEIKAEPVFEKREIEDTEILTKTI